MVINSYFEMETCVMLYESLFMIVKIALPPNENNSNNGSGLFFATQSDSFNSLKS